MTLAPRQPPPPGALPYLGPDGTWWDFQWSVQVKQPQIQIQREYTPLPPPPDQPRADADGRIRFFVRRLPRGEVSNYLAKMNPGDSVELRLGERGYAFAHVGADTPEDVVCLAGGTGIATAMQVAHAVLGGNPARGRGVHPDTKVRIVWAVRTRSDLQSVRDPAKLAVLDGAVADLPGASDMARRLLEMKRHYGDKLSVQVAIDDEGTALAEADLKNALQISPRTWARRPTRRPLYPCALPVPVAVLCEPEDPTTHTATTTAAAAAALETNHAPAADLHKPVFVCGPQGFVDKLAGEVVRHPSGATFRTGGLLGELDAKFGDPARPWLVLGFP
ncbi:unnamed protein product [Parascedosporium putredinis]|uniref:FAD-binding FR-type domain-containing protein n=1 Tax=Parascedosporium putredinis TaxID=1442378 RepID=A0A9P1H0P4_9PEZI|nr:unnamed protein product [Parascedosporium putredinis]CAI7993002.1 unnamed protein product [Parascedosporium putredinis]